MVNRLILNLSQSVNVRENSDFRTRTGFEPPVFVEGPILGNIGGPVSTNNDSLLVEEYEDVLDARSNTREKGATDSQNSNRAIQHHSDYDVGLSEA